MEAPGSDLNSLGIETVAAGEQYILYGFWFIEYGDKTFKRKKYYFATKEMAKEAYITIQYYICIYDRCLRNYGGELWVVSGGGYGVQWPYRYYMGESIHPDVISAQLFTKINDNELMNPTGQIMKISMLIKNTNDLNKHLCVLTRNPCDLPRGMYDEHMLVVLRIMGLPLRIKRQTFSLNPFKKDYVKTDEATARKLKLVVKTVVVKP